MLVLVLVALARGARAAGLLADGEPGMSLLLPWVIFPLVLVLAGAGWGALVELAAGTRVHGALLVPLGWAAVIIFTLLFTEWNVTAPATVPVVAIVAAAGLAAGRSRFARSRLRSGLWPALAALGVFVVYGAPVLAYGHATFTGIVRLDDTSTWLNVIDHAMTNLHPARGAPLTSTYQLTFTGDVGPTYPLGAFMLPAVGRLLTGIDAAWIVQPYMALCAAAVGLAVHRLTQPLIASPRIRAAVAFIAAQPALLYGYALWGGDKEMAAAFLLALGAALLAQAIAKRPDDPRGLLPLAVAAGALIDTLTVGAVAWVGPALVAIVAAWAYQAWAAARSARAPRIDRGKRGAAAPRHILVREVAKPVRDVTVLCVAVAAFMLPVWLTVSQFLSERAHGLYAEGTHTPEEALGNLFPPGLSGWQLAGIWPVGDFRTPAPTVPSALLIGLALVLAVAGIAIGARRREFGVLAYVTVALVGCLIFYLIGASPWALGKSLAIGSPALLAAAATGAGMLWSTRGNAQTAANFRGRDPAARRDPVSANPARYAWVLGMLAMLVISGGVIWSNVLAYGDATLAPHAQLAELERIGELVKGKGPTFINEYEVYADRHFLREGEPTEPAEYRPATLPLRGGAILTKSAWSQLNAFAPSTLYPYRSIVTRRAPAETRPPSIYNLVWQGAYYQLWQRPEVPTAHILEMVTYSESNSHRYCGNAENSGPQALCPIDPVSIPSCPEVKSLARKASAQHGQLIAYESPGPTFAYGDEVVWPGSWFHEPREHVLEPLAPGTAIGHLQVTSSQNYELWLDGGFGRGFEVSVDGRKVGTVKNELSGFGAWSHVTNLFLSKGVHTFAYTYPSPGLGPGSAENEYTALNAVLLQPKEAPSGLVNVSPQHATRLCGHSLQWIEIVTSS
ncbi:MAG: hypothetical protein ACYDA6_06575 [Solirubrobacteraceae bacterium]